MNKREQAELAALRQRVAELEALNTRTQMPPRDLKKPTSKDGLRATTFGYDFRMSWLEVEPVSSESHLHKRGVHQARGDSYSSGWSQNGVDLYSTRLLALRALRAAVEVEYAKVLTRVDAKINDELKMETA